jgi:hypothetical protein
MFLLSWKSSLYNLGISAFYDLQMFSPIFFIFWILSLKG